MEFYEKAEAERVRQAMPYDTLRAMCSMGYNDVKLICQGKKKPTASMALRICSALHFDWDVSKFPGYKAKAKKKDLLAEDERKARELGLSYGTYCAYRDTGYLETYKKRREEELSQEPRKVNIIESNIGGGSRGRYMQSVGARKL